MRAYYCEPAAGFLFFPQDPCSVASEMGGGVGRGKEKRERGRKRKRKEERGREEEKYRENAIMKDRVLAGQRHQWRRGECLV